MGPEYSCVPQLWAFPRGTGKSRNKETRNETKRNDILRLKGHGEAVHVHLV